MTTVRSPLDYAKLRSPIHLVCKSADLVSLLIPVLTHSPGMYAPVCACVCVCVCVCVLYLLMWVPVCVFNHCGCSLSPCFLVFNRRPDSQAVWMTAEQLFLGWLANLVCWDLFMHM